MRQVIATGKAPQAIGPYSQAIVVNGMAYLSGQIPIDPATGHVVDGEIAEQTEQILKNISNLLEACGSSLAQVVKTTVFMVDLAEFQYMNKVYGSYFASNPPARSTVQVARLPRDVRVEIEAVAIAG